MAEAIGETLVFAAGVALSPVPIIAIILVLVSPRARANGPVFLIGWLVGLGLVGAIALVVTGPIDASVEDGPAAWIGALELALGVTFVLIGFRQWRSRPMKDMEASEPAWMGAISSFTAPKTLGAGAALAGVNPTNLLLVLAAAAAITKTGLPPRGQAGAWAVFALVATVGVGTPVLLYFGLRESAVPLLGRMKASMTAHQAVIMAVLCLLIGVTLIGNGITALA